MTAILGPDGQPLRRSLPDGARARAALSATPGRTAYTGASRQHQSLALFRPSLRSADADALRDAPTLRARARDLYRNHPYARMAVRASVIGVVGRRMRYSCRPDHRYLGIDFEEAVRWGQEFERLWENYAHGPGFFADAGRRMNFSQLMRLALRSRMIDGEALGTFEWSDARRWRTALQLVDVDRLSTPPTRPESIYMRSGVELGRMAEPVAYHVRNAHPAEIGVPGADAHLFDRVLRETDWGRPIVAHSYDVERAGQTRGVSAFAPVILDMTMGREFQQASLQQMTLHASYAAVLTSQQNYREAMEILAASPPTRSGQKTTADLALEHLEAVAAYHDSVKVMFDGSAVPILFPGEKLELLTPGNTAAPLKDFQSFATRGFAAGLGVDPIAVSQDYSNVNYSSAKMAGATSWRTYEILREDLIGDIGMPWVGCFLEEVVHSGAMPLPARFKIKDFYDLKDALIRGTFLTQGAPNLDPVKEAQALAMEMAAGTATLQDACAAQGDDYLEKLDQMAREVLDRQVRGLPPPGVPWTLMLPQPSGDGGDGGAPTPAEDA